MTDVNKYNPYPDTFSMRCPRCQAEAIFDFPFSLAYGHEQAMQTAQRRNTAATAAIERWGSSFVLVHHPDLVP